MRVISGVAGGLRLEVPDTDMRPTMDKVKGAIFSSLGERVPGAHVLDLFGGCGGLGIEALSRGAASVLFIEQNRKATEVIRRNLEKVKLNGEIQCRDVHAWLAQSTATTPFDIILADPPYWSRHGDEDHAALLLLNENLPRLLSPDGLFILEKDPRRPLPATPYWEAIRSRNYGKTEVLTLSLL